MLTKLKVKLAQFEADYGFKKDVVLLCPACYTKLEEGFTARTSSTIPQTTGKATAMVAGVPLLTGLPCFTCGRNY